MILLTEIAARYIATCHPYEGRPYLQLAEEWKKRIAKGEREIPEDVLAKAFPHAYRVYKSGRDLRGYFESLDKGSHNMLMRLFLGSCIRRKLPEEVLRVVIEHIEYCSVKVCQVTGEVVILPSFTNTYTLHIDILDWTFLQEMEGSEGYYFLHGYDNGKVYVIREATEEDFIRFKDWFEERRKSLKLPSFDAYKT